MIWIHSLQQRIVIGRLVGMLLMKEYLTRFGLGVRDLETVLVHSAQDFQATNTAFIYNSWCLLLCLEFVLTFLSQLILHMQTLTVSKPKPASQVLHVLSPHFPLIIIFLSIFLPSLNFLTLSALPSLLSCIVLNYWSQCVSAGSCSIPPHQSLGLCLLVYLRLLF